MVSSDDWHLLLSVTSTLPSVPAHCPWKRGRGASSLVLNNALFSYLCFVPDRGSVCTVPCLFLGMALWKGVGLNRKQSNACPFKNMISESTLCSLKLRLTLYVIQYQPFISG